MNRTWLGFAAVAAVAGALAAAPCAVAEPFLIRNQHPIAALYGLPAPLPARLPAPGQAGGAVVAHWSNFATTGTDGERSHTLDGEGVEARLRYDRALGERFAVHGELAWRSLGAGTLDSTVDGWHEMFGLPNGSRDKLPRDQLLLEYRVADDVALRIDRDASGLADVPLSLGYRWHESPTAAVTAWLTLKAPVGRARDFTGTGALDAALSVAAERQVAPRWQAFGQVNAAWLGEGDLLPGLQREVAWSVLGGATWNAWRRVDLSVQLEASSAVLDTGVTEVDGAAAVLTFGGSYRTPGGWRLDLGVSEDIQADASPDVVFTVAARRGF